MRQLPEPPNKPGEYLPSPAFGREKGAASAAYPDTAYYAAANPDVDPESGNLLEYCRILRRRKGTVILVAFLGAVIGFLVTLPQTPVYQTKTSLEIVALN